MPGHRLRDGGHVPGGRAIVAVVQAVAWQEGWKVVRQEAVFDVLTERRIRRPVFSDPKTWEKQVMVSPDESTVITFVIGDK